MRIGLCGTISVGKTTLVNALKELPEFKDYNFATERSKYLRDLGIPLNTDSTINGQMVFMAERASELLHENIITDRTIIDVLAFTHSAKSIPYFIYDDFENVAKHLLLQYDYIFYISPEGVELEDNGVRVYDAEYREVIDKSIQNTLLRFKHKIRNLHYISGNVEERVQKIKDILFPQYL
jgi:nicotinamide riboside kinase